MDKKDVFTLSYIMIKNDINSLIQTSFNSFFKDFPDLLYIIIITLFILELKIYTIMSLKNVGKNKLKPLMKIKKHYSDIRDYKLSRLIIIIRKG